MTRFWGRFAGTRFLLPHFLSVLLLLPLLTGFTAEASAQIVAAPNAAVSVVTEGEGAPFTIGLSAAAPTGGLEVNLTVSEFNADYVAQAEEGSKMITIPEGETSAIYTVPTVNDEIDGSNGLVRVVVAAAAGSGYTPGSRGNDIIVQDNDPATLSISAPADAVEGNSSSTDRYFRISLSETRSSNIHISVCFSGDATRFLSGARDTTHDYGALNTNIVAAGTCINTTVPANTTQLDAIGVRVYGDTVIEFDETVTATVSLVGSPTSVVLGTATATHTIETDDTHHVTVDVTNSSNNKISGATEGDSGHNDYTVNLRIDPVYTSQSIQVKFCLGGTAVRATDYDLLTPSGTAIIHGFDAQNCLVSPAQLTMNSALAEYTLRVQGDVTIEPNETITFQASAQSGVTPGDVSFGPAHTFTILTNDTVPLSLTSVGANPFVEETGNLASRAEVRLGTARNSDTHYRICFVSSLAPTASVPSYDWTQNTNNVLDATRCHDGVIASGQTSHSVNNAYIRTNNKGPGRDSSIFNADNPDETITITLSQDPDNPLPSDVSLSSTGNPIRMVSQDDDLTRVRLDRQGSGNLTEGGSAKAEFRLTLDNRLDHRALVAGERVDVPLVISGTDITAGDYTLTTKSGTDLNTGVSITGANTLTPVVILQGAGARIATLELTPTDDTDIESTETLRVELGPDGTGANGFGHSSRGTTVRGGAARSDRTLTHHFEVDIADNDQASVITIARASAASLTEGNQASFTLSADPPPASSLTVRLNITDAGNADFLASTVQGARTVSIPTSGSTPYPLSTVADAIDEPGGPVTITIAADTANPARYTISDPAPFAQVTVHDNDATTVTLTTPDTDATEGSSTATAQIVLTLGRALRAGEILAIPLQFSGGVLNTDFGLYLPTSNAISLTGHTVTFTGSAGGSATVATLSVLATEDADADPDSITVSIPATSTGNAAKLTATGMGVNTNTAPAATGSVTANHGTITVTDNDTRGLTLTSPAVTEGGSGTYTVVLDTQPGASVTVTITANSTEVTIDGTDADTTFTNSEDLIFTTTNWNQPQTVTIRAAEDDDTEDDRVTLTHAVSGGGYGATENETPEITITDNDSPGLVLPATLTVNEGATGNYTVRLSTQPGGAVTVTIGGHASTDLTIDTDSGTNGNQDTLTFRPTGANLWSTEQTVTVTAASDNDRANDAVTLAHTAIGGGYNITGNVAVTITDTTPAPPPPPPPPSTEPGTLPEPTPTTPGETPTEPQPPEPQPVIPLLSIQAQSGALTEGSVATFTITAEPAPVEPITVPLTIAAQGDFTTPESIGAKPRIIDRAITSLMIPTLQDFIDEADGSVTITLQAADGYSLSPNPLATIEIHDDDTAGIALSTQGLRIDQIGETGQYTVQLTSEPQAPVQVTVLPSTNGSSSTPGASPTLASASVAQAATMDVVSATPSTLTFVPDHWNIPQTVTLTAQREGRMSLRHRVTSQDPNYHTLPAMEATAGQLAVLVGEDLTTVALPWQTRFARTSAGHVIDSISERIQSTSTPGLSARLAGYRMDTQTPQEIQSWTQPPGSIARPHSRAITLSELLSDSSMSWSATATDGSIASLWAQGAFSEFDGQSGETTLNGEVLTTLLGVDQTHTHGQRGLVLSYSQAEGQYQTKNKGEIESEQTLLTPWMSRQVNDRMTLWGALGYGTGDLTLQRSEREDLTTDTHTAFVALGSDAILREEAHRTLSIITDALWLRTRTEAVTDGLELNHATAHASRMRVGIKGSGRIPAIPGIPRFTAVQALKMNWESALRHDGGDAESGFGVEVGGGVQWTDSRRGLNLQINGRSLITHHDSDIKDRGLSLSMGFNPSPAEQGFTFTLKQDWGTVSSGRERLLTAESLEPAQSATEQRFKAQAGVGFTIGDGRYIARPHLGVGLYAKERETTLGWRLQSTIGRSERTLGLKLTRHENDNQSEHRMKVEAGVRW